MCHVGPEARLVLRGVGVSQIPEPDGDAPSSLAGGGFFAEGRWAFLRTTQPGVTSPSQPAGSRQSASASAGPGGGIRARDGGMPGDPRPRPPGHSPQGAQAAAVQLQLAEVGQVQPCGAQGERSALALPPWHPLAAPVPRSLLPVAAEA